MCVFVCVETEIKCGGRDGMLGVDRWKMCRGRDEVCGGVCVGIDKIWVFVGVYVHGYWGVGM